MPKERAGYQCSRFCFGQAFACLRLARLNLTPLQRDMFIRMAGHWKGFAEWCGGQQGMWPSCATTKPDPAE